MFINWRPRGKFKGSRDLTQRDPLSPFLFTLVVDALDRLIDKPKDCNELRSFTLGRDNVEVTHIQFADDYLFLWKLIAVIF